MSRIERYETKMYLEDRLPHDYKPGIIAVGKSSVEFACPCGCESAIWLRTSKEGAGYMPHDRIWDRTISDGGLITISPSINLLGGCRSHFFIRESKVVWA